MPLTWSGSIARSRRGRGEGSVYFVELRNEWVGSISLGVDPQTGKRRRATIYGSSKKETLQRLADFRARTATELSRRRAPTLREFAEGWLEREVRPNRRATTHRSYAGILQKHVLPVIGTLKVNRIEPSDVERCLAIIRETAGASMASKSRTVLRRLMQRACALEVIGRNPVDNVEAPTVTKRPMQFLDAEQLRALFAAAESDRFEALVVVLAIGGIRIGEALALTWADVNFEARTIRVEKTAQEAYGSPKIVEPKTAAGRRTIALGSVPIAALRRRRTLARHEGFAEPTNLVFPTTTGTVVRQSNLLRRWWVPLLESAGLERVNLHALRHSSASLSLLAGTSFKVIADRLGHTDPGFTSRVYSHAVDVLHHRDAAAVDALLKPKKRPAPPRSTAKRR